MKLPFKIFYLNHIDNDPGNSHVNMFRHDLDHLAGAEKIYIKNSNLLSAVKFLTKFENVTTLAVQNCINGRTIKLNLKSICQI